MADSEALPVILFGKLPSVTAPQIEALLPEIDVIHLITSLPSAIIELPSLLPPSLSQKPTITHPSSGKASNTTRSPSKQRRAVVVIVGGGFSEEEFEELRGLGEGVMRENREREVEGEEGEGEGEGTEGNEGVVWLRADNTRVPESEWPPNPVYPGRAAGRIKDVLRERGFLGEGMGDSGGEIGRGAVLFY